MEARIIEPRVMVIEGHRVLVVERRPPLQPTLDGLLSAMRVVWRVPLSRVGGTAPECVRGEHRFLAFYEGIHAGLDGISRRLRLFICRDCEGVSVRDITLDRVPGLSTGRRAPRRRDHQIGWYTGARRRQREYR